MCNAPDTGSEMQLKHTRLCNSKKGNKTDIKTEIMHKYFMYVC